MKECKIYTNGAYCDSKKQREHDVDCTFCQISPMCYNNNNINVYNRINKPQYILSASIGANKKIIINSGTSTWIG